MRLFRPLPCALLSLALLGAGCAASPPAQVPETQTASSGQGAHAPLEQMQAPIVRSSMNPPPPPLAAPTPAKSAIPAITRAEKPAPPAKFAAKNVVKASIKASHTPAKTAQAPKNLNLDKSKASQHRHYKISYQSQPAHAHLKRPQEWKLKVLTKTGKPVTSAKVRLSGSCPQNGKHLSPATLEAKNLGHGYYQAKGLVFPQPGWWVVTVDVVNAGRNDRAQFNLLLK